MKIFQAVTLVIALGPAAAAADKVELRFDQGLYDHVVKEYGRAASSRIRQWQRLIENNLERSDSEKLHVTNAFFNRQIRFIADSLHWLQEDYWATPIESLGTQGGDCEDFSIAKYFTLRALGIAPDKLRLMYVNAVKLGQPHMVVIYSQTADKVPLVLDNLTDEIALATQRTDLTPVYSFNGEGLWLAKTTGLGTKLREQTDIKRWEELIQRIGDDSYIHYE